MTHRHLLIQAGAMVDDTSRFFFIWIGEGKRANSVFRRIADHAAANGYYFGRYYREVEEFLHRVEDSLGHPVAPRNISGENYLRNIRSSSAQPLSSETLHNAHRTRIVLDVDYRVSCYLSSRK